MVGACQQNSGIFLVRGGGLELEICGVRRRTGSGQGLGQDTGGGQGRDWDKMPVTKSPGR